MLVRRESYPRLAVYNTSRLFTRIVAQLACRWPYRRTAPPRTWPTRQWESLLSNAALLIRREQFDEAMQLLSPYLAAPIGDAAYLNLVGAICEGRRQWKRARKFYGRAMRANRSFEPAQKNLRRLYELHTFGRCGQSVSLGDEVPGLWLARFHDTHD